jgi:transposase
LADTHSVEEVADMLKLGQQTICDYRHTFLRKGVSSLNSQRLSGRPSKLTKAQQRALAGLIKTGSQAAGYTSHLNEAKRLEWRRTK